MKKSIALGFALSVLAATSAFASPQASTAGKTVYLAPTYIHATAIESSVADSLSSNPPPASLRPPSSSLKTARHSARSTNATECRSVHLKLKSPAYAGLFMYSADHRPAVAFPNPTLISDPLGC